jgi:hypothetical protein
VGTGKASGMRQVVVLAAAFAGYGDVQGVARALGRRCPGDDRTKKMGRPVRHDLSHVLGESKIIRQVVRQVREIRQLA